MSIRTVVGTIRITGFGASHEEIERPAPLSAFRERIAVAGPGVTRPFDVDQEITLVKAGVNYRFGSRAAIMK